MKLHDIDIGQRVYVSRWALWWPSKNEAYLHPNYEVEFYSRSSRNESYLEVTRVEEGYIVLEIPRGRKIISTKVNPWNPSAGVYRDFLRVVEIEGRRLLPVTGQTTRLNGEKQSFWRSLLSKIVE